MGLSIEESRDLKEKKLKLIKAKLLLQYRNIFWCCYIHLNTKNKKMTFNNREFLIPIYKAIHKDQIVSIMKSVQCGVSECFVVSHFEQAERGLAILYVLPKTDLRNRFVQNRIDRTILKIAYYREILSRSIGRSDSTSLKAFGEGVINYVASNSPANFTEFPADAVYYDERDRMDQDNILLAKDRLSDSIFKFERSVSNPTISEYGVAYEFDNSSKGYRFFKCPHCGKWQKFDFFKHVVIEIGKRDYKVLDKGYERDSRMSRDVRMYCIKKGCRKRIDRFNVKQQYVHEFPDKIGFHTGFQVSKLFSPQGTIKNLVDRLFGSRHNESKFQIFLNSELGLPMSGIGVQITRDDIMASRSNYVLSGISDQKGVRFCGIDVGTDLHTVIRERVGGRKKMVFKGRLKTEQDVIKLIQDYKISVSVIDALPETRMVENIKNASDKVYNCFFGRMKETSVNKKSKMITVQRTLMLDRVKENYERSIMLNPKNILDDKEYMKHMQSNVRIADLDSGEFVWLQKSNRPDHFLLSEGYCDLAGEIAIGSDIWSYYEASVKKAESEARIAKMGAVTVTKDEMDELPQEEQQRLYNKSQMSSQQFFNDLLNNTF